MTAHTLYWFKSSSNFGDLLSPIVCSRFLAADFRFGRKWEADVSGMGSILNWTLFPDEESGFFRYRILRVRAQLNRTFRRPLIVWGSGLLGPVLSASGIPIRRAGIFAVRGARTRDELRRLGAVRTDVALGDPGLLVTEVWPLRPTGEIRRGFVLHAYSWEDGTAAAFAREHPEAFLIDPRRHPEQVLADVARCREIFSSSLHGLVMADALGLPNRWIGLELPWMTAERSAFKFRDYFSALGIDRTPCRVADAVSVSPEDPAPASEVERRRCELKEAAAAAARML